MGICSSCESTHIATAKLILQDGKLQEFSYPVKVSYVLAKYPAYFICNADEMEFDNVVSSINDDENLQPGQLYFALPLTKLNRPLQAEEMAALAVKATSALMKSGGGGTNKYGCRRKSVSPLIRENDEKYFCREVAAAGSSRMKRGSGQRKFTAMLNSIPE